VALLLTPAKLLIKKLKFPFSFNEITNAVVDNAIEQNRLLKQTDEITVFWTAFAWGVKNGNLVQVYPGNRQQKTKPLQFENGMNPGNPYFK
jgi:hypothetical protein